MNTWFSSYDISPGVDPIVPAAPTVEETTLFKLYFRVSNYNTIDEKLNSMFNATNTINLTEFYYNGPHPVPYTVLRKNLESNTEPFDGFELGINNDEEPLIEFSTPDIAYSNWFFKFRPLFDNQLPYEYFCINDHSQRVIGSDFITLESFNNAVELGGMEHFHKLLIDNSTFETGANPNGLNGQYIEFVPARYVSIALEDIIIQLMDIAVDCEMEGMVIVAGDDEGTDTKITRNDQIEIGLRNFGETQYFDPPFLNDIFNIKFEDIPNGNYKVLIKYRLPNRGVIRSKTIILTKQ